MNTKTLLLAAAAAFFVAGGAQAATLTLIPSDPLASFTGVLGINSSGQMTGSEDRGGVQLGFVRDAAGNYTTFSVGATVNARSIDNAGNAVGYATGGSGSLATDQVFVRHPDGTVTIVQNPATHTDLHGIGSAENASGVLVGDTSDRLSGFVLDGSTLTTFQAPGAVPTSARGIEDDGTIAGFAFIGGVTQGYILTGGAYSFFTDPNATAGSATFFESINNHGVAAGQWKDAAGTDHAFAFNSVTDVFTEINVPGANGGVDAFGVNDLGQVVLQADFNGVNRNYLYDPNGVPEPATWAMMLMGFFGLGSTLRRRATLTT